MQKSAVTVSKVVDENGEPMLVHHGSAETGIEAFDAGKAGTILYSDWGKGIYFTPSKWMADAPSDGVGPMTTAAVWNPGTCSRTAENVLAAPYVVLDFDGFDGIKPEKPDEIEKHRRDSLAIIRWIREGLQWRLAAIVWTGSKSLHAWFHTPPPGVLQSLRNNAAPLGIDAGLIGRPEHPCRLPGQRHEKTGGMSRVIWLAECLR